MCLLVGFFGMVALGSSVVVPIPTIVDGHASLESDASHHTRVGGASVTTDPLPSRPLQRFHGMT